MKQILCAIIFSIVLLCSSCQQQVPAMEFEKTEEYIQAFIEAINEKDETIIDRLLSSNAVIAFPNGFEEDLGESNNEFSYIHYLLSLNTQYTDVSIKQLNASSFEVETLIYNDILNSYYGVIPTQKTTLRFVVENKYISAIYMEDNEESIRINELYSQGDVGIEYALSSDESYLLITYVIAGTPARVIGLEKNDRIYAINGIPVSEMNAVTNEVGYRLLGLVDSEVILTIQKENQERQYDITLVRMDKDLYAENIDEECEDETEGEPSI